MQRSHVEATAPAPASPAIAVPATKAAPFDVLAFYAATLLSSIGSMTFTVCLTAFMLKAGHSFALVGLALAANRLAPLLVNLFWGDIGDHVNARRLVAVTESLASVLSLGLLWTWWQGPEMFGAFLAIMTARSFIVALQGGARAKLVKLLSDATYTGNARQAIRLNKATHGATLFAGILGWLLVRSANFADVILFDMTTFMVGGVVLWLVRINAETSNTAPAASVTAKFRSLYAFAPQAAKLDLLLAVVMCGTGTLMARLAGNANEMIPLFLVSYGAAVWIAGYLERLPNVQRRHESLWLLLGAAYLAAFLSTGTPWLALGFAFVKDVAYWMLFHRYSTFIQMATPKEKMAAVTAARSAQMIAVLALGEVAVGQWQAIVPPTVEGAWRLAVCVGIATLVLVHRKFALDGDASHATL